MTRRLLSLFFCLIVSCMGWAGDTGTYKIDDYKVRLTPHSDGNVTIEYYQKWSVTGGHIPWITVGVPNSNFTIKNGKGAVRNMSNASGGGWAGVRVDLDRDYKPGESFQVWFSIEQAGLFQATGGEFKLDFTPGWYDRAVIGQLAVTMNIAAKPGDVKSLPQPTSVEGQEITWVRNDLGQGQQIRVSIAFPKTYMPNVKVANPRPSQGTPDWFPIILVVCLLVVPLILRRVFGGLVGGHGYSGGSIFYGGLGGGTGGGGGGGGRSSSGGGGFGGSSLSCACACVACACACACAGGGGGGAGCSKKTTHSCPLCRGRKT
jgi:hypothetical protein